MATDRSRDPGTRRWNAPGDLAEVSARGRLHDAAVILAAVFVTAIWFAVPGIEDSILRDWVDDAFFYVNVARNIADGLGSTCDGIAATNGYHPLWMLVNVCLCLAFPDPLLPLVILQFLLLAVALLLLHRYASAYTGRATALLLCLAVSFEPTWAGVLGAGMETHLAFIGLLMVLWALRGCSLDSLTRRDALMLQVALSVLFFARLDGGLLWVALGTVGLLRGRWRPPDLIERGRALFRIFLIPTLLACAYLLFNRLAFSTAVPISGRIKAIGWSDVLETGWSGYLSSVWERLGQLCHVRALERIERPLVGALRVEDPGEWIPIFHLCILILVLALSVRSLLRGNPRDLSMRVLFVYAAFHTAYYGFLQQDAYSLAWAKGPELLVFSLCGTFVVSRVGLFRFATRTGRVTSYIALALVLAVLWNHGRSKAQSTGYVRDFKVSVADFRRGADYVKANTSKDEVVTSFSIGFLGHFAERRVMSVDGLLNSVEYHEEYLRKGRTYEYLQEHDVRYFVNAIGKGSDPVVLLTRWLRDLPASSVRVSAEFDSGDPSIPRRYVVLEFSGKDSRPGDAPPVVHPADR